MKRKIFATFCTLVFSAMLTGCGTQMGQDISSDISSMMPDTGSTPSQNSSSTPQQNSTDSSYQSDAQNSTSSQPKITKEQAKEIALKHANIKAADITDYEIDLDTEDGKLVYDISFEHNGKEYDYDVDAETGKITNSKNEIID